MRIFLLAGLFSIFGWLWFDQAAPLLAWTGLLLLLYAYQTGRQVGIRQTTEALEGLFETPEYIAQQRETAENQ